MLRSAIGSEGGVVDGVAAAEGGPAYIRKIGQRVCSSQLVSPLRVQWETIVVFVMQVPNKIERLGVRRPVNSVYRFFDTASVVGVWDLS